MLTPSDLGVVFLLPFPADLSPRGPKEGEVQVWMVGVG